MLHGGATVQVYTWPSVSNPGTHRAYVYIFHVEIIMFQGLIGPIPAILEIWSLEYQEVEQMKDVGISSVQSILIFSDPSLFGI